ncbi:AbfB domain-containing protein [Streptomyces cyanogenus]|uniref:Alpha-L-arabinofuranosidase B (ABFB) n=1 Tax=Streptomyces cyanogenus TaxID=80860 RepID=A0ABX7TM30_STRCY|nr:AbfB domain-containing protein [Streptomyces cyanogenus]QTD97779.1 Alpha-L-arabinofuranosidase B (ABFB) [Streptomyces cyanogenus]
MPEDTPRIRRLWPAAALALAVAAACVTVTALNDQPAEKKATAPATPPDNGPGLLSFASPSTPPANTPARARHGTDASPPAPSASEAPARPRHTPARSPTPTASTGRPAQHRTSVRSLNYPDRYWHISGGLVKLDPVGSAADRRAATFTRVRGLADARCYSFATADGSYLRHRGFLLRAEPADGSPLFQQDATFCPRASVSAGAVMLESVNYPGRFLRHQNFQLKLDPYQDTGLYRSDSAFLLVDGLA